MTIKNKIIELANSCSKTLQEKIAGRMSEMQADNHQHYLIYKVLGITSKEGELIDIYQNKGRFLYKYACFFFYKIPRLISKVIFSTYPCINRL